MARKETGPIGRMGTDSNGTITYPDTPKNNIDFSGMTNGVEHMRASVMGAKYQPTGAATNNMESLRGSKYSG